MEPAVEVEEIVVVDTTLYCLNVSVAYLNGFRRE